MSRCHGHLGSFPPYVGGDDDEVDGFQAECMCGWKGAETPYAVLAQGELIKHLNEQFALLPTPTRHEYDTTGTDLRVGAADVVTARRWADRG